MTQSELQRYLDESIHNYSIGPLYVPRRFTALPESGSVSSDLEFRAYGMLREREPALKEILTHPAIAIVADPGAGKSVVGRASVQHLIANGGRVPVFAELKQYRVDLPTLLRITTPTAILDPAAMVEGFPLRRTYVLDGIDETPAELVRRLGTELREFIAHEPQAHFVFTARQAFYVANRNLLPPIPAVFHILPFATEDIEEYCTKAGIDPDRFMDAIHTVSEMQVFSVEETKTFLKVALPTMYGTLFGVAVTTGMRPSEYIGFKWQDVDWEHGTVSVKRTLRKGPTGQWEYGETKRTGGRRLVKVQNWVLARLKQLQEFQAAHPVVDPEEWPEAVDLIFVTELGRPVNVNSLVYKHFKPILRRAGLPNIRLYDLRHTAATLALTVGVSPKVVSEQLGHTSAAFTLDVYSHVLPHMQDDAAAKVEAALMSV